MVFLQWFDANWFDLFQTLGIVGSLLVTDSTRRAEIRSQRVANLLELTKEHREIWAELNNQPGLYRILDSKVDLEGTPVAPEEERFIRTLILHLNGAFHAMKDGVFIEPDGLEKDMRRFFARPIARAVWERMKSLQDGAFVEWVDSAISKGKLE
jgi:hypothetical protein